MRGDSSRSDTIFCLAILRTRARSFLSSTFSRCESYLISGHIRADEGSYIEPGTGVERGGAAKGILYPPELVHDAGASVSCRSRS